MRFDPGDIMAPGFFIRATCNKVGTTDVRKELASFEGSSNQKEHGMESDGQGVDPVWDAIVGEESNLGMARLLGVIGLFIALTGTMA